MNIYGPETERCRELQRQLHDAEQFRALVAEMRAVQRRIVRDFKLERKVSDSTLWIREKLESMVDGHLRLLDSE